MKVAVTGGTGFVGAHITRALVDAGHDVVVWARDPARADPALAPLGIADRVAVSTVALTDPAAVADALTGIEAVVHAAAVFSFHPKDFAVMAEANAAMARTVLDRAVSAGCDPVVHISSTVAVTRRAGGVIPPTTPLGDLTTPYARSKVDSDVTARALQESGKPIVRIHPAAQLGPHDPHLGEGPRTIRDLLRGRYPAWSRGVYTCGDVRDTAATVAAVMAPGLGPRAFVSPTHDLVDDGLHRELAAVTGRRLSHVVLPSGLAVAAMRAGQPLQRLLPNVELPINAEGVVLMSCANTTDDSETLALGVAKRPLAETLADTIKWLVDRGELSPRQAGRVVAAA